MQIPPPQKKPHINICLHLDNIHVRTHFFTMHVFIQKKAVYMNIVYALSPFFIMFTTQSPIIGIFLGRFVGLLRQSTYVDLMPTEAQRKPIAGYVMESGPDWSCVTHQTSNTELISPGQVSASEAPTLQKVVQTITQLIKMHRMTVSIIREMFDLGLNVNLPDLLKELLTWQIKLYASSSSI